LTLFSTALFATNSQSAQYTIVVDAGSSGSRLHIFQYDTAYDKTSSVPVIQDIFSESVKPGLSSYANNPDAAGASLKKLLDDAIAQLNSQGVHDLQSVSVNVLGTAGMRLLPDAQQTAIYQSVTSEVTQEGFHAGSIQTITGQNEGVYGWLDVNYLMQRFQTHDPVGAIDLGGASTQITFKTNDTTRPADEVKMTLAGQTYTVFSKSFLGLGGDQARDTMNTKSLAKTCYPSGYVFNKIDEGYFNFEACSTLYSAIIDDHDVKNQIAPLDYHTQQFVAFSGVYYAFNFFDVAKRPEKNGVESRIKDICGRTWSELQKKYPTEPEKFLSTYCAGGTYIDALLYNTYQLQGSQLTVTNSIDQHDIDWTLGWVLYSLIKE
jgi:hypothetical protein